MNWENVTTILLTVFASTGFWQLLLWIVQTRQKKKSAEAQMIMGLGHDRICYLGETYIKRGYINRDEYENLHDYLYLPYQRLGGNGTAQKIMEDVKRLPLHDIKH